MNADEEKKIAIDIEMQKKVFEITWEIFTECQESNIPFSIREFVKYYIIHKKTTDLTKEEMMYAGIAINTIATKMKEQGLYTPSST